MKSYLFGKSRKDIKQEKKILETEIQNLKIDIYLLAELKSTTSYKKVHAKIEQYINHFIEIYDEVHIPSKATGLEKGGDSYKFIMNTNEDTLARIMHNTQKNQDKYSKIFSAEEFLKEVHPKVALKINNIQNKIDQRTEQAKNSQTWSIKAAISKFFDKLGDLVRNNDNNFAKLHHAMHRTAAAGFGNHDKLEIYENPALNKIRSNISKFTNTKKNEKVHHKNESLISTQNIDEVVKDISSSVNNHRSKIKHVPPKKPLPIPPKKVSNTRGIIR